MLESTELGSLLIPMSASSQSVNIVLVNMLDLFASSLLVERYDKNKVVKMTDPIVRITRVPMITESRAMRSSVSLILAETVTVSQFHWFLV